jgi:MFS family permease
LKKPAKVFYGWWIVAVGLVADTLGHGAFQKAFTLYFLPVQKSLGLTSAGYSQAELLGRLAGGIQAPAAGYVYDRIGVAPMMVAGGATLGVGFILLYFTNSYLYFLLVYVVLLSAGSRLGFNNAASVALNQWFRRKRSLAMSIVSVGQGLGGVIVTPVVTIMIIELGWRTSALISGIVIAALVVPLSLLVRRTPESMGLLPDGDPPRGAQALVRARRTPGAASDTDFTVKEAMATPSYWLFTAAAGLRDAANAGLRWHLAPIMVWSGVSLRTAGFLIAFMSLCNLIFSPFVGWMGDRWSAQKICALGMVAGVIGVALLLSGAVPLWELVLFMVLLAFSETANPLTWAIMGDFFGRTRYGSLRGWQQLPNHLVSMPFPWVVGLIFDKTGSYFWAIVLMAVTFVAAAALSWVLPRPRLPARPPVSPLPPAPPTGG